MFDLKQFAKGMGLIILMILALKAVAAESAAPEAEAPAKEESSEPSQAGKSPARAETKSDVSLGDLDYEIPATLPEAPADFK